MRCIRIIHVSIMAVFWGDSLGIHSLTQSFVNVFLYYTRMLWASSPPRMEGETYREGWPGNCGEACSWLSHRFPFSLSTSNLSLSVKGHGGGEEGEKTINGPEKKNRPN